MKHLTNAELADLLTPSWAVAKHPELLNEISERLRANAVPAKRSESIDEIRATLTGLHQLCASIANIETRVGPLGSHARGYTHKIKAALRHLDAFDAAPKPRIAAEAAPVAAQPLPDFEAFWKTLPIPGEFDSMDSFDQSRWRAVVEQAYRAQPLPWTPERIREAVAAENKNLPPEAEKWRVDLAVSNGANSISMPDYLVEVAAWIAVLEAAHKIGAKK